MDMSDEGVNVKSSRLKSPVWNDFDRIKKGDTFVAICRHCKKKLSGSSTSGTSHLRNHLIRCRKRTNHDISALLSGKGKKKEVPSALVTYNAEQEQRKSEVVNMVHPKYEQELTRDGTINVPHGSFDNKRSHLDLARMIILHGYPLGMVEHVGFQVFVKNLQPLFDLVTVNKIEAECNEIYLKEKQKVYELLDRAPGKISLSLDLWVAKEDLSYFSLTAHFIDDDWQLKKRMLNFLVVDPSHTEDVLSEEILASLKEWDIDRKLFSIAVDSNPTNDNIVSRIRERLSQNRFLLCNGQIFEERCAANIIKLMVLDALEALSDVTQKIRESIRYVKSSQATQEKFNEMVQMVSSEAQKYLCVDNPVQWNTTYYMLEVSVAYKEAFSLLQDQDPSFSTCPSHTEWTRATTITGYLKLFLEVTNVLVGNHYPTSDMYFTEICHVHAQLIEWCEDGDEYIRSLALRMKEKFDEYWKRCSLGLAVAAILDPRLKLKVVEYYYPQIYGSSAPECINIVSNCMKDLYNAHAIGSPLDSNGEGLGSQVESRDRLTGFDKYLETTQSQSTKFDLDMYLNEPLFPRNNTDFNILNWWKVHTPRYPILSMMARNVFAIPVSKVSLEMAFCTGDRMLDHRSSLRPDTVQALMCTQDWLQSEPGVSDFKSSSGHSVLAISYYDN